MIKIPTIELIKTSPNDLSLVKIDRESLWSEFGQLKIADSIRKQYDKSFDKNLAPSTINVRLAAIKSLVDLARKLSKTTIDLGDIESINSESDRDPASIAIERYFADIVFAYFEEYYRISARPPIRLS